MSLLLEALKKAALQKRHSEEAAKNGGNEGKLDSFEKSEAKEGAIQNDANQTVDDQSALQKNALQKKKARDKWLEQNEPISSVQKSSVPDSNTVPSLEHTYSANKDQKKLSDVADTSIEAVDDNIAPETEAVPVGNIEFGSNTFSETASSDLEIDLTDGEIEIDELEVLDSEDELGEEIDFANEDVELERNARSAKSKTAMAELLEKSHRVVRRTRRREIYLYAFFFLTAVGSIGAYYYYLSLNDYSLQISKLSSAEEAQIIKKVVPIFFPILIKGLKITVQL